MAKRIEIFDEEDINEVTRLRLLDDVYGDVCLVEVDQRGESVFCGYILRIVAGKGVFFSESYKGSLPHNSDGVVNHD